MTDNHDYHILLANKYIQERITFFDNMMQEGKNLLEELSALRTEEKNE
jgi:hypothetical protein